MASAKEMLRRFKDIKAKLPDEVEDLILTNKQVKEAKRDEFLKGVNPDGSKIGTYRNPLYARRKFSINSQAGLGNVDLIVSGNFERNLYPYQVAKSRYLFANRIDYGNDLIRKYGEGIVSLNQDTFNTIQRLYILPDVIRFMRKGLGQI